MQKVNECKLECVLNSQPSQSETNEGDNKRRVTTLCKMTCLRIELWLSALFDSPLFFLLIRNEHAVEK